MKRRDGHTLEQHQRAGRRGRKASPWNRHPMVDSKPNRERYRQIFGIEQDREPDQ